MKQAETAERIHRAKRWVNTLILINLWLAALLIYDNWRATAILGQARAILVDLESAHCICAGGAPPARKSRLDGGRL